MSAADQVQAVIDQLKEALAALCELEEHPSTESRIGYAEDGIVSALGYLDTVRWDTPEAN